MVVHITLVIFCFIILSVQLYVLFGDINIFHYQRPVAALLALLFCLLLCHLFSSTDSEAAGFSACVSQATTRETDQ